MKKFSDSLLSELEKQLKSILSATTDPVSYSQNAIKILVPALEKLKSFLLKYHFENKAEEINFFREIKPKFASKLIFYNEVFNIASNKPFSSKKAIRKYYVSELKKLESYFIDNIEFYRYYRSGNRCLDNKYFLRGKHDIRLTLDSFYLQADQRVSTSHDYKIACILANELLTKYLENELAILNGIIKTPRIIHDKKIKWTGSKVALIELIYALHAEALFNDGTADLKETVSLFENMFGIDLGQFHRAFLEIRSRKTDRTKFLNTLTRSLEARMDIADEN